MDIVDLREDYKKRIIPALMQSRGYKNVSQVPKLQKIVVNCSVGSSNDRKAALDDAVHDITVITGQKPAVTRARTSISNFKLREDMEIGCKVTLRGRQMYDFLMRLVCIALPSIRDFRGISPKSFDGRGAYTLGIKDHSIFPELELDKIKRTLGMDITVVTTGKNAAETRELLDLFGFPFSDKKNKTEDAPAAA
ncbi:MAG: 50S ribosomal protein L5 [Candidatus Methylacidiphilales bacterium]